MLANARIRLARYLLFISTTILRTCWQRVNSLVAIAMVSRYYKFMPNPTSREIKAIEARVKKLHLTMSFVCRYSGISRSTWSRWRHGTRTPTVALWDRVICAVTDLEAKLTNRN